MNADLIQEIEQTRSELKRDIEQTRSELKRDIREVELRLEAKIETSAAQAKIDIIKWVVGLLVAQTGLIVGFMAKFMHVI